jgi:hypothetical protein
LIARLAAMTGDWKANAGWLETLEPLTDDMDIASSLEVAVAIDVVGETASIKAAPFGPLLLTLTVI